MKSPSQPTTYTTPCQVSCAATMHEGLPRLMPLPWRQRLGITLANLFPPRLRIAIRQLLKKVTGKQAPAAPSAVRDSRQPADAFRAGDVVRVRNEAEIRATLGANERLKGCRFMPGMAQYCGTTQRIFKPVERYLNECDYTIRKARGLVLLENVFCQGIEESGRCDRSCFYFWRVEWLERVPQAS